mgnify:CR=1 FL=1
MRAAIFFENTKTILNVIIWVMEAELCERMSGTRDMTTSGCCY